ncbi:MAG: hypothetical protein KBC33_00605 [Candidatus Pacebacteria bacterium]|nr:hypothetical protein [Candidatus Paceibacterota bacterium]
MAITDILAQTGDGQDFLVEIPAGNPAFIPNDVLLGSNGAFLCSEIPAVTGGGSNIFIMSE